MLVVMVGTAVLIITLSVFNGLEGVITSLHNTFNPDLEISPIKGKSFAVSPDLIHSLKAIEGVEVLSEIIEDNALLRYGEAQMVVTFKGVSENYTRQTRMDSAIVYGRFTLKEGDRRFAVMGRGVQNTLSVFIQNSFEPLQFWYPKRNKKINLATLDPEKTFNRLGIIPAGVFSLEQSYDEKYVFVPLDFAEKLAEYQNRRTSLEIKVKDLNQVEEVKQVVKKMMGDNFAVKNSQEQEADLLRAIFLEKIFVFITLSCILAIASFNIFFSLMMLVIDKQKDIAILRAMGANTQVIRRIFLFEGIWIAFSGALTGLILGTVFCLLQQKYGFISMGTTTTVVSAYPVELKAVDFVFTAFTIILITLISSYIPAINATRVQVKENL